MGAGSPVTEMMAKAIAKRPRDLRLSPHAGVEQKLTTHDETAGRRDPLGVLGVAGRGAGAERASSEVSGAQLQTGLIGLRVN